MSIEGDEIESQLVGEGIVDDENTEDQTHASLDLMSAGNSLTSGVTLDRDLVTTEALEEMTPIMSEIPGSSSDYHPDDAYTNEAMARDEMDKETIVFREVSSPMHASISSGRGQEKQQGSVKFAPDEVEIEDESEDDQEEAEEQARSYLEDLVYNDHSELPLHATPSLQQPLYVATPYASLDLMEEIPGLLEEVPILLRELPAPSALKKKASEQYLRRKDRYSLQSGAVNGGSLSSSMGTLNTHQSRKSETFIGNSILGSKVSSSTSYQSLKSEAFSGNSILGVKVTSSSSHPSLKSEALSSNSIMGNKVASSSSSSNRTVLAKERNINSSSMKERISPDPLVNSLLHTLSAGPLMPSSFQGESSTSIQSKGNFAATYVMERLESSPNPPSDTRQRRPLTDHDAPVLDQPTQPTRSYSLTKDTFRDAEPNEMRMSTPIDNENVAPTKRTKKKEKKVKTKKTSKKPRVDTVSDGTAATRRRNLKLDIMKRLAEEEVIVEAPIISLQDDTMGQDTRHNHVLPMKSKMDHQNSPRPRRVPVPGAAHSPLQPTNTKQKNRQEFIFDLDEEMGLPRGTNFHLPREAQRVLTAYTSVASSDGTDDGVVLMPASEIDRKHQRFENNFSVPIYDQQPKEDRGPDEFVAYAVEIPAQDGQKILDINGVPVYYGDSSSDHIFKTKSNGNRKTCKCFLVFACFIAGAVATAWYIFNTQKLNSKSPQLSVANATSFPTNGPTLSTDGLKELILGLLPDTARSLEKDTPQHDAFTWLESEINGDYKGDYRRMLQRYALAVFYYSTGGPQWPRQSGWMTSDDECTWEFTSTTYPCNTDGNIIWIDMRQNSLIGGLPVEVSRLLPTIRGIDLSENQLDEVFPTHLQMLVDLEYYSVEANHLTGSLPSEIGLLTNIQYLSLSQNRFSGIIPSIIGRLTNLRFLSLAMNSLTGTLPTEFGLLRNIETVDLERNRLNGTIPPQFQLLPGLSHLALSMNFFTGGIPSGFGNINGLTSLTIDENDLVGPVPSELGRLTALRTLWLHQNALTGNIPSEFGSIQSLVWLDMSDNLLQGSIPEEIGDLTNLEVLKLNDNDLEWAIPASIGKCKRLSHLILYGNRLNGTIPGGLGDLFLDNLDLRDNNLTGSLPDDLVDGVATDASLDVSGNLLTGTVPNLICEKLAIGNGELKVDCTELVCDPSCCPSCAFQSSPFDTFQAGILDTAQAASVDIFSRGGRRRNVN